MKTTMTERDKKLLVGMLIGVIIVAIGYWGILPQVKRYNKLETKIEIEEDEKKINQIKIANAGSIEMAADTYEEKIAEKKDEFYQIMTSSEIDRMMTQLATESGLDIYELSFNMPETPSGREAYQYSELYKQQQAAKSEAEEEEEEDEEIDEEKDEEKDSSSSSSDNKSKSKKKGPTKAEIMSEVMGPEEGGYQANTDIYAVPVTMTVGGDLSDLDNFVEKIISIDKRVLLVGYSWGQFRSIVRRDANGNIITESDPTAEGEGGSTMSKETTDDGEIITSKVESTETIPGETVEIVTKKSLTVKLEIFMCDTEDVASSGDASEE